MKKMLIGGFLIFFVFGLMITPLQSNAVSYTAHDGSVDKYLEKALVKSYPGKPGYWSYIVKACADTHNLAVAAIILKSDLEQKILTVNKNIKKGDCSHYGAVMKAKDGNTLGADLIEKHEATVKLQELITKLGNVSKDQRKNIVNEILGLFNMIGVIPRF